MRRSEFPLVCTPLQTIDQSLRRNWIMRLNWICFYWEWNTPPCWCTWYFCRAFANLFFPRFVCRKRSCVQVATTRQGCWFGFPDIPRRDLLAYVTNTKYTVTNTGFCSGASVSESNGGESNGPLISVYKAYYLRYLNGWWGDASVCLSVSKRSLLRIWLELMDSMRIKILRQNKSLTKSAEDPFNGSLKSH